GPDHAGEQAARGGVAGVAGGQAGAADQLVNLGGGVRLDFGAQAVGVGGAGDQDALDGRAVGVLEKDQQGIDVVGELVGDAVVTACVLHGADQAQLALIHDGDRGGGGVGLDEQSRTRGVD